MSWFSVTFGSLGYNFAMKRQLFLPLTINGLGFGALAARNSGLAMLSGPNQEGPEKKSSDESDGEESNSEADAKDNLPNDRMHHQPGEHREKDALQSSDALRSMRATGVREELTGHDRTCPADGTAAEGPSEKLRRDVQRYLHALQEQSPDATRMCMEDDAQSPKATTGERCSPSIRFFRDATTTAHALLEKVAPFSEVTDMVGGMSDFGRNMCEMENANHIGVDKYFHCMANCESTDRGLGGAKVAIAISAGREAVDFVYSNPKKGLSVKANAADCMEDLAADALGFYEGAKPGTRCEASCGILRPRSFK